MLLQINIKFPIIVHMQTIHNNKAACSVGVHLAQVYIIVVLDRDDALLPNILYEMIRVWWGLPDDERASFAGVTGLCQYPEGSVVGDLFPHDRLDATTLDIYFK